MPDRRGTSVGRLYQRGCRKLQKEELTREPLAILFDRHDVLGRAHVHGESRLGQKAAGSIGIILVEPAKDDTGQRWSAAHPGARNEHSPSNFDRVHDQIAVFKLENGS